MRLLLVCALVGAAAPDARAQPYGEPRQGCDPYVVRVVSPRFGFGADFGTGAQDSAAPASHFVWSVAAAARYRLTNRISIGTRAAMMRGGDEGVDVDGDGSDDDETGSIGHFVTTGSLLVGWPVRSGRLSSTRQLELGGGYARAITDAAESGPVAEVGVSYQVTAFRFGLRGIQGFGDAEEFRAGLLTIGLAHGAMPDLSYGAGCPGFGENTQGSVPYAIGFEIRLSGWGFADELRYLTPGIALELPLHLRYPFDLITRWDLLTFTGGDRDKVVQNTLLGGLRIGPARSGWLGSVMAGYALSAGTEPHRVDSGPVVDLGVAWDAARSAKEGAYVKLHARFGVAPSNRDLRAVFLSVGGEIRNAQHKWYRAAR